VFVHNHPSFSLLFQRSKYRSYVPSADEDTDGSEKEREEKRRETERYLTTAIGFCIRYDQTFRSHFLTAICNVSREIGATPVDVFVEPFHWGDLVVVSRNGIFACVVECKVHAKLQEWQNPETEGFETQGYGKLILDEFQKTQKIIRYIVLGWRELLTLREGSQIQYAQKSWHNLEQKFPRYRPLAKDLYTCLAAHGVPDFMLKETQNMKLGNNTKFLAQALELLPAAQIEAGLDETSPKFECLSDHRIGWWYFGTNVKRTKKAKTARGKLQEFVNPKEGCAIAWYGYDGKLAGGDGPGLSFWFYCRNAKAQRDVENRLRRNGINNAYIQHGDDDAPFAVIVRAPLDVATKEGFSGDRSWFSEILKAAMEAT